MKKVYVLMVLTAACMVFAGCGAKEKEAQQPVQQITGEETQPGQDVSAKEDEAESQEPDTADLNQKNDDVQEAEPTEQTDEEWLAEMEAYEKQHAEETARRREVYEKVIADFEQSSWMKINLVCPIFLNPSMGYPFFSRDRPE